MPTKACFGAKCDMCKNFWLCDEHWMDCGVDVVYEPMPEVVEE